MKTWTMTGLLVALVSIGAVADSRNFYFNPDGGLGIAISNKVGGVAPAGWLVEGVVNANNAGYPPTTNPPAYVNTANGEAEALYPPTQENVIGIENVSGTGYVGDGQGSWGVGRNGSGYGYVRFFSAMTQVSAAYYVDSSRQLLTLDGGPNVCDNVLVVGTVNPAYQGLYFDTAPSKYMDGSDHCISGSVNTTVVGGINTLSNDIIMVYWRTNEFDLWKALDSFGIQGNGDFNGTYAGGTEVMIGMKGGSGILPNSANQPVVPLPEPFAWVALFICGFEVFRHRRFRQ